MREQMTLAGLFDQLQDCLRDGDVDAARFIREGIDEYLRLNPSWITDEEQELLDSL